jgi:uncharacterized protein (TIGR02117 family)
VRWLARLTRIIGWTVAGAVAALAAVAAVTARSGDQALYPARINGPRVEVLVVSHGYHAGLAVPLAALGAAARRLALPALLTLDARFEAYGWIEVGWGDEGFYTSVPTVASLTVAMGLRALFKPGNPSVLHVAGLPAHPRAVFPAAEIVRLDLSDDGFDRLASAMDATFARAPDGVPMPDIGPGLYGPSLFFRANGTFHLFHVCNHWVADMLDVAGVPTAPLVATATQGLLWDLRWRAGATPLPPPR